MTINADIIPLAGVGCLIVVGTKDRRTIFRIENGGYSPILRPYAEFQDPSLMEKFSGRIHLRHNIIQMLCPFVRFSCDLDYILDCNTVWNSL